MKLNTKAIFMAALVSLSASAYEFSTGKFFVRGAVGPMINVFRYDAIPEQATPSGGLMLAGEVEYVVSKPWSVIGGFRPTFATGAIDLEFGVGGKYRWDNLDVPLVLYGSVELTPALLVPTNGADTHFNLGIRPGAGLDYFVMHNLIVGAQLAVNPSILIDQQYRKFEASIEFLFSVMYEI
jgi:hypothetical protein